MDIQINITEEEMTGMIRACVKEAVQQSVNQHFDRELRSGYMNFMDELANSAMEKIPEYFESEREYLINKRYEEAIEWFEKHLASIDATWKCERAASMKLLSDCYAALGFENARELWLWKAMNENPRDRDAPFILGRLLILKKQYRTALEVLQRCVDIESQELDYPCYHLDVWTEKPYLCLAEAKFYCGDWEGALIDIEKGLSMNPNNEIGQKMRAEITDMQAKGMKPLKPPPEAPRERIEIPELIR